jgi:nitroimidazol reductase NimA-like FMN-containing flavoprotein (pyridoxamine 5'-phosphate oxidase superfamily)
MDVRETALQFLKAHTAGVLATVQDGKPHASAVYYVADENFNIYFLTLLSSRKFQSLKGNPSVAFVVGAQDVPQTLQIEGTATELTHDDDKQAHIAELTQALTSNPHYYAPLTQLDQSDVVMVWIKPSWVRWGDYAAAQSGTANVLTEIPLTA